jgi:hypothetical protein
VKTQFPAIAPTTRSYRPPRYPITDSRSQQGIHTPRLWGDTPSDAVLLLGFENILTSLSASILEAYDEAIGEFGILRLPPILLAGAGPRLQAVVIPDDSPLRWSFAEQPDEQAVPPDRSTVRVRLVGQLRLR